MNANNRKKDKQLGMAHGTAVYQLRKALLFQFVQLADKDVCHQCDERIESIEEFSIEHMEPWQGAEDPKETFFDLDNIAYSHLTCNIKASRTPNKRQWTDGQGWCWRCQTMKSLEEFPPCKTQKRYRSKGCTQCESNMKSNLRNGG